MLALNSNFWKYKLRLSPKLEKKTLLNIGMNKTNKLNPVTAKYLILFSQPKRRIKKGRKISGNNLEAIANAILIADGHQRLLTISQIERHKKKSIGPSKCKLPVSSMMINVLMV